MEPFRFHKEIFFFFWGGGSGWMVKNIHQLKSGREQQLASDNFSRCALTYRCASMNWHGHWTVAAWRGMQQAEGDALGGSARV